MIDSALRLLLAVGFGALIGLNRDLHKKDAGVRTHALVALGAALIVVASARLSSTPDERAAAVSRAIQGVLTGIGFLGAGVILRDESRQRVHGLTTAASIWVTALFGVACGVGAYFEALAGIALAFLVLVLGGPAERLGDRLFGRSDDPGESRAPIAPPPDAP
jgi:putative Mg2+ transporter-C (MgtC) family protein